VLDAPVCGSRGLDVYSRRAGHAAASPAADHSPAIDAPPPSPEWERRFFRFLRVGHSPYPLFVLSFPLCLGSPECGLWDCFSPRDG